MRGNALACVSGFKLSDSNYSVALDLLRERYENKQLLISTHMNNLLKIEPLVDLSDAKHLRIIYDNIETQIRSLENLDIKSDMYGPLLIPVLLSKIPEELNLIISRQFNDNNDCWDVTILLKALRSELTAREKTNLSLNSIAIDDQPFTAANMHTGAENRNQLPSDEAIYNCVFCDQKHKPQHCKVVTDLNARKSILQNKRRCFSCLKKGHISRECRSSIKCHKCSRRHHLAVCNQREKDRPPVHHDKQNESSHICHSSNNSNTDTILLQTASVEVKNNSITCHSRILFDSGSQLSYITPELKTKLGLKVEGVRSICIKTLGSVESKETLEKVNVCVKGSDNSNILISCYVKNICQPLTGQKINLAQNAPHLKRLQLADSNINNDNLQIDLLIGSDNYWKFMYNEIVRGPEGAPVAIRSKVGYVLSGPVCNSSSEKTSTVLVSHVLKCQTEMINEDVYLNEKLHKFFEVESTGTLNDEDSVYKHFREDISFDLVNQRYKVLLPFKETHETLPDNYSHCIQRLDKLKNKMINDKDLLCSYNQIVKDQLSTGIVERLNSEDSTVGEIHYLPHRPVVRSDKKTTKIRMVFDASSKTIGPSLNDCLYPGPSLTESLFGVLLRFRTYRYAFISDIEKAFLQIILDERHRDVVRFIWFRDLENLTVDNINNAELAIYRICRVLFGVTSSPFLLTGTLVEHANMYNHDPQFVEKFLKSLHVDDLNSGGESKEEVLKFYTKCKERLAKASFNLRKFESNSSELEKFINPTESPTTTTKVLGIVWHKINDTFNFNFQSLKQLVHEHPTKRQLIKFIASIYDPLGLLNPFIVKLKILFQKVCVAKVLWDVVIPRELLKEWDIICSDIDVDLSVSRWYGSVADALRVEIHGFSDASLSAYGCCIYIKIVHVDGAISSSLVTSKSRVAPVKPSTTIPRLELMGTLLLSKLIVRVEKELSSVVRIDSIHCWTDSMVVLHWIVGGKVLKSFVQKRVDKIKSLIPISTWLYIPSHSNPADIVSRGASISQLNENKFWFKGPTDILLASVVQLEKFSLQNLCTEDSTVLLIQEEEHLVTTKNFEVDLSCINISKYNDYNKLLRVTALVLRFISNLKKKVKKQAIFTTNITLHEIQSAEHLWLRFVQINVDDLQLKRDLGLYKEDQLIRCKGRLGNAPIPYDCKYPIFVPKGEFAILLIKHFHILVKHNGVKETLNQIRTKYWIPKARYIINNVIRRCNQCLRAESKPFSYPDPPSLPKARLSPNPSFTYTAVDYAGPLYVRNIYNGKIMFKTWIFLFTCSSTRAICLDLVPSCSAQACVRGLQRFISRRGVPCSILSDNGTQFIADETQQFAISKGIKWKFNPPASPWWGGIFERLVRCVKRCLKKVLGNSKLTYEELLTILLEIEVVLNNRPLTFTYENPGDEVLTPSHLLFGRRLELQAPESTTDTEIKQETRFDYIQTILRHFWSRWKSEYIYELREHHKQRSKYGTICEIGDVVLIHEDRMPRAKYKVGIVESFKKSRDGCQRIATVRYLLNGKVMKIERPVSKLYPTEAKEHCKEDKVLQIKFIDESSIQHVCEN